MKVLDPLRPLKATLAKTMRTVLIKSRTGKRWGLTLAIVCACLLGHDFATGGMVLTDQAGRRVRVEMPPRRIVALAPSITEIVFALGQGHRLVGVSMFSNYPPEADRIAKIGSYIHPDLEKIVALDPDLCLVTRDGNPQSTVAFLEGIGVPVYVVDPHDMSTVMGSIEGIARVLNVEGRGAALIDGMRRRIDGVLSQVAQSDDRPGVFFQVGIDPIISIGSNTFIDELIRLAGGRNLASGPIAYPRFSREQVLALDPDVIIVTSMARDGSYESALHNWRQWHHLSAVRHGRLHRVDSNLFDRPGPRLTEALEILCGMLHPQGVMGRTYFDH